MCRVAKEEDVPLINVYTHATEWFTSLGPEKLTAYLPVELGGHMNRVGAEMMAQWMAEQLIMIIPELKPAPVTEAGK